MTTTQTVILLVEVGIIALASLFFGARRL